MDIKNIDFRNLKELFKENLKYKNIFLYYPTRLEVDENDKEVRTIIYDFKDGKNTEYYSSIFVQYLKINFSRDVLNGMILIPIPASKKYKNEKRYKILMQRISDESGIENGYDYVYNLEDRGAKHLKEATKDNNIGILKNKIENKKIILLDDIITTGKGFKEISNLLIKNGAKCVEGLFLGRTATQREYNINYNKDREVREFYKNIITEQKINNQVEKVYNLSNPIKTVSSKDISSISIQKSTIEKNIEINKVLIDNIYNVRLTEKYRQLIQNDLEIKRINSYIFENVLDYYIYNNGESKRDEKNINFISVISKEDYNKFFKKYLNKTISILGTINKKELVLDFIDIIPNTDKCYSANGLKKSLKFTCDNNINQNRINELYDEVNPLCKYKVQTINLKEKLQEWNRYLDILQKNTLNYTFNLELPRLKNGINNLILGKALNSNLINFIYHPENLKLKNKYIGLKREELLKKSLNESQFKAVEKALNIDDLFLIQGISKTEKSDVVVELCYQLVKHGEKILISSKNNINLDSILNKLQNVKEIRGLRLEDDNRKNFKKQSVKNWIENVYINSQKKLIKLTNYEKTIEELTTSSKKMIDKIVEIEILDKELKIINEESKILKDKILNIDINLNLYNSFKEKYKEIDLNNDELDEILEKAPKDLGEVISIKLDKLNELKKEIASKSIQENLLNNKINEFKVLDPLVDIENEIYSSEIKDISRQILNYDRLYEEYSAYERDYENIKYLVNEKKLLKTLLKDYEYDLNKKKLGDFLEDRFTSENSYKIIKTFESNSIAYNKIIKLKDELLDMNKSYLVVIKEYEAIKSMIENNSIKLFKIKDKLYEEIILLKDEIPYLDIKEIKELSEEVCRANSLKLILKRADLKQKTLEVIVNCDRSIAYLKELISENKVKIEESYLKEDIFISKFVEEVTTLVSKKKVEIFNILKYKDIELLEKKLNSELLSYAHYLEENLEKILFKKVKAENKFSLIYEKLGEDISNTIEFKISKINLEKEKLEKEFIEINYDFEHKNENYKKEMAKLLEFNKLFSSYFKSNLRNKNSIKNYEILKLDYLNPKELKDNEEDKKKELYEFWSNLISPENGLNRKELKESYLKNLNVVATTYMQSTSYITDKFDTVIIEDASSVTFPELLLPMLKAKRIILMGDCNQIPSFLGNIEEETLKKLEFDNKKIDVQESLFKILFEKANIFSKETLSENGGNK